MTGKAVKIIVVFLAVAIIASGIFLPTHKAQAISLGDVAKIIGGGAGIIGICKAWSLLSGLTGRAKKEVKKAVTGLIPDPLSFFGGDVPVYDKSVKREIGVESEEQQEKQDEINCIQLVGKALLSTLKKRLLDALVDETVKWIQGGGDPRFITNLGGFFEDAAQAAIGDTVQAIGLGDLCYPQQKLRLQLQLTQPVFSQRITCTLDDIVGNVSDFINDFDKGGWVAYREIIKPQNNRWGLELLAQDELLRKQSERRATAEYEASVGGSFLAQKRCLRWQQVLEPGQSGPPGNATGDAYYFETPNGKKYNGKQDIPANQDPNSTIWKCVKSQTITPGLTIGESVTKAIGTDIDFIVNTDDLTTYVAAIIDAMTSRLTKETTMGLLGLFTGEDEGGARGTIETNCSDISDDRLREACEDATGDSDDQENRIKQELLETLDIAEDTIDNILTVLSETRTVNNELINVLNDLIACQQSTGNVIDPDAQSKYSQALARDGVIDGIESEAQGHINEISALRIEVNNSGTEEELLAVSMDVYALAVNINATYGESLSINNLVEGQLSQANADLQACSGTTPTCSDEIDNDGDGFTDYPDEFNNNPSNPDCASPNDSENRFDGGNGALAQCEDTVDNDGDGLTDTDDPGCHTDGDAGNAASYNPSDNDETDVSPGIPNVEFEQSASSANENAGATTFEIVLSFAASGVVTVDYDLLGNSTANLSSDCNQFPDFCLPNNLPVATVTFPAGTTSQLITIGIYNDTIDENNESVILQLISPSGANLGSQNRFTLTIVDNDGGLIGI